MKDVARDLRSSGTKAAAAVCDWDFALRMNLTAPLFVCQFAAKIWIDRGVPGSIVNVARTTQRIPMGRLMVAC